MTELGTRLKEARLSKGYSLDDLQEITKIQKRYLSAIEEGNYSIMPGTFYVRAFIKQYAEAVDLSADELLETYKSEVPANKTVESTTTATIQQPQSRRSLSKIPSKGFMDLMPKLVVALFIIMAIVVFWYLFQQKVNNNSTPVKKEEPPQVQVDPPKTSKPDNNKGNATAAGEDQNTTDKDKTKKDKKQQKLSKGTLVNDNATTDYTLTGAKDFKIRVEVSGETWVGVQDENRLEISKKATVYHADDIVEVDAKGKESVRIRLGAASNAKVFVNDEEVEYAIAPANRPTQNIVIKFSEKE
ncbi:helix-turn-helix domain-containing protein [Viridibacillus sp. YIM B01967]|uniref:Helix-turn-helix domain-containing protein n=1 Tax=Viridibacillus soli TaxID=2798301 RepID=A0ABS1H4J3_9BACL|nr:helix-turn-helix domain-containing protein [Viridibacillus soli]